MSDQHYNHKELMELIKRISGQANFIGTPRIYVDMFDGDLVAAVWLNQVVYWDGKNKEPIGFYKTYADWKKELGLSEYQVRRVAKECEVRGLVNIAFKKVYGTPKNHYLVVWPALLKEIRASLDKSDPEETQGSESEGSEGEENKRSMEGANTSGSLSIEEIPPENIKENNPGFAVLEKIGVALWPTDIHSWRKLEDVFKKCKIELTDSALTISGLGMKAGVFEDRYTREFERTLVGILNKEVSVRFCV